MDKVIKSFKGMDSKLKCQGFQYEVGKEYEQEEATACKTGFHACQSPLDVFSYYPPSRSRYCEVEQSGKIDINQDKTCSSKIKINAEIGIVGLVKAHLSWVWSRIKKENIVTDSVNHSGATSNGDQSGATSNGYHSGATSNGYHSGATSNGDHSGATSNGYHSGATSNGYHSGATSNGYHSGATSNGDHSGATSNGYQSGATSNGDQSGATSNGDQSGATSNGYHSGATSNGDQSGATSNGDQSGATSNGDQSGARVNGHEGIAVAWGFQARSMTTAADSYIVVGDWRTKDGENHLHKAYIAKPGDTVCKKKIKANVWYWFENGKIKSEEVKK